MSHKKRKHHWLPQFYIKGFLNKDKEVYVFDKKDNSIHSQGKNGTFHSPYFYTVDFDKYEKRSEKETKRIKKSMNIKDMDMLTIDEYPDVVEDVFSESENNAAKIIPKLINCEKINDWERIELATFIAFMYTRTPTFRKKAENMEKKRTDDKIKKIFSSEKSLKDAYDQMRKDNDNKDINLEELYAIVDEDRYKISIPRELSIQNMLYASSIIDKILYEKTWYVMKAHPKSSFITSDVPVLLTHSNQTLKKLRFDTPGTKIIFPLSSKALLIMKNTQYGPIVFNNKLNRIQVRKFNKAITTNSNNYIIAKDKSLLSRMVKKNK